MAHLLFPQFMEDNGVYDSAEIYWQEIFDSLARQYGFIHHPYFNTKYSNGRKMYLGNPMYTAMDPVTNRGVRIVQCSEKDAQALYISGDVGKLEDYEGLPEIDELVIDLVLSEESKAIAENWIRAWLVDKVHKAKMEALIDEKEILVKEN